MFVLYFSEYDDTSSTVRAFPSSPNSAWVWHYSQDCTKRDLDIMKTGEYPNQFNSLCDLINPQHFFFSLAGNFLNNSLNHFAPFYFKPFFLKKNQQLCNNGMCYSGCNKQTGWLLTCLDQLSSRPRQGLDQMSLIQRWGRNPLKSRFEAETNLRNYDTTGGNCLVGPQQPDRVSSVVMDIAHSVSPAALPVTAAAHGTIIRGSQG